MTISPDHAFARGDERLGGSTEPRAGLADEFLIQLHHMKKRLMAGVPESAREELAGVTWYQVEVLHQLGASSGAGISMSELAKLQACAMSSATAVVDRLITQGLAERRPDPEDRRVIRIAITAQGDSLLQRFSESRRRVALDALEPLSDEEVRTLVNLLDRVTKRNAAAATTLGAMEVAHG